MTQPLRLLAILLGLAVPAFAAIAPAHAQTQQEEETCRSGTADPDDVIRTCSLFIRSGRWARGGVIQQQYRWTLFTLRGNGHLRKGDWDKAIADFDHSIELNDTDPGTYYLRSQALQGKGRWDQAIADLRSAGRLDKKYADAFEITIAWDEYLREIQEQKDTANWTSPPFDTFRKPR